MATVAVCDSIEYNLSLKIVKSIKSITSDFSLFSDWREKYQYIIELGSYLETMPEKQKNHINRIHGCISEVWLVSEKRKDKLYFLGTSNSSIIKGLLFIIFSIYSQKTPQEIQTTNSREVFERLGLLSYLSASRSNGITAIIKKIQGFALQN